MSTRLCQWNDGLSQACYVFLLLFDVLSKVKNTFFAFLLQSLLRDAKYSFHSQHASKHGTNYQPVSGTTWFCYYNLAFIENQWSIQRTNGREPTGLHKEPMVENQRVYSKNQW